MLQIIFISRVLQDQFTSILPQYLSLWSCQLYYFRIELGQNYGWYKITIIILKNKNKKNLYIRNNTYYYPLSIRKTVTLILQSNYFCITQESRFRITRERYLRYISKNIFTSESTHVRAGISAVCVLCILTHRTATTST